MLAKTHRFVVDQALNLTSKKFKGYEKFIEKGCIGEDTPSITFNYNYFQIIGSHHFYHPIKKVGYFKFFNNAKQQGLFYFEKAVELYKKNQLENSFIYLGKALHMLADIASPSHTKLEFHFIDIFEHYINSSIQNFKLAFKSRIIPRISAESCFERLARISFRIKYKKSFILDTLQLLGVKADRQRHRKLHKISNKILSETIISSAILLSLFNIKTRRRFKKRK
jgi:hypothetical protein